MNVSLPLTWRWLGEGKVPPNHIRTDAHPRGRWAVSYNLTRHGEFALCVEQTRPYGPTWHSVGEALRAGWLEALEPCCSYRDHGASACACPEHERSALHPFGGNEI